MTDDELYQEYVKYSVGFLRAISADEPVKKQDIVALASPELSTMCGGYIMAFMGADNFAKALHVAAKRLKGFAKDLEDELEKEVTLQ